MLKSAGMGLYRYRRAHLTFAIVVVSITGFSAQTPVRLFNGKNLSAWKQPVGDWQTAKEVSLDPANNKKFTIVAGEGVLVNGPKGTTKNLISQIEHGDVEAHIEFIVPKASNSGIYFMGRYEVQVLDSWGVKDLKYGDCGGIYASCSEPKPDSKGTPPRINASKPPGEWQTFDIIFRAPRFDSAGKKIENAKFIGVVHNGQVIHENVESPRPTCAAHWLDEKPKGPLMLQGDHGPVAYRNLMLKSVDLR
jgi:hypothetical protein